MLAENELKILTIFQEKLLLRKDDLKILFNQKEISDGMAITNRLSERGFLKFIDAVGAPCYTITQEGLRVLRD